MKDGWFAVRRGSLIALIVLAVLLILAMFVWHNIVWGIVFSGLFALVLIAESVCYIRYKKTISTVYGEFLKKNRAQGYTGLALFLLAMIALVIHLGAYSKDDK